MLPSCAPDALRENKSTTESPATGIVAPGLTGNRGYDMTGRDPETARALLEEAGYGGGFSAAAARPVAGGRSAALHRRETRAASRFE